MPAKTRPNPVRALRSALRAAEGGLSTAVERYDLMGWFDDAFADDDELAEAAEVEAALTKVTAALKRR